MTVLVLGCLWVLAATVVALLPMRFQYVPGLCLLLAAPVMIWLLGQEFGWIAAAFAAFAFLSMFRRPLLYYAKMIVGRGKAGPVEEGSK